MLYYKKKNKRRNEELEQEINLDYDEWLNGTINNNVTALPGRRISILLQLLSTNNYISLLGLELLTFSITVTQKY